MGVVLVEIAPKKYFNRMPKTNLVDYIDELLIVSDFMKFSEKKSDFLKSVDLLYKSLTNLIISGGL